MTKAQIPTFRVSLGGWLRLGIWGLGFGVLLAFGASGCAKARAEAVPDGPPLQVPEPPQRVLAPVEEQAEATAPTPEVPPAATAAPPPARPAEPRPKPAPAAAQAPPQPPVPEPRELRAGSAQTSAVTERSVRDLLARAQRDLSRVDYGRLSVDGRAQYDQSKRFSAQAEQAVKERNITFAATLADKAATLAAELVGR